MVLKSPTRSQEGAGALQRGRCQRRPCRLPPVAATQPIIGIVWCLNRIPESKTQLNHFPGNEAQPNHSPGSGAQPSRSAGPVAHHKTGQQMEHRQLAKDPDCRETWLTSFADEIGNLFQGIGKNPDGAKRVGGADARSWAREDHELPGACHCNAF